MVDTASMLDAEEVVRRVTRLKGLNQDAQPDRTRIREVMNGGLAGMRALLGDRAKMFGKDVPAPNLILSGLTRLAQKIGRMPTIKILPPPSRHQERAQERASKRERIVQLYDRLQRLNLQLPQVGRWLPGYGYAVWVLRAEEAAIQDQFKAAREHLKGYLLEPYRRQPHITLFVCGFLVEGPQYNDDFTQAQLEAQIQALEKEKIQPFEIEIGDLNSFASAPYLEVHDPEGGIARLREILSRGAREFRTAPYTPHLTVGLYADAFPSEEVMRQMAAFSSKSIRGKVEGITMATYQASEFSGRLIYRHDFSLRFRFNSM